MKIAICGAHRVGKTTLTESLQEALPGYECKAEPYYELQEAGVEFSEVPTLEDYTAMLEHSIEQVFECNENVIFDRCPLDMLAYIQAESENFDIQSLYQRVQDAMSEIDLLVFIPIEEPDLIGCSDEDLPGLRGKVNSILIDWISDFSSDTIEVKGSTLNRKEKILKRILK